MAKPLTQFTIDNLKPAAARREVPDGRVGGLYLIVQPSAARSWAVRYRFDGKQKKHTLGPYPAISLAAARNRALEALGDVAGGKDPAASKKAARVGRQGGARGRR